MVLVELLVLLVSVIVLSRSSSLVVDNAVKLSTFFKIQQVAVGFVFIAVATTLPELSVSVMSATTGSGSLAAGNVFGSVITNILLIMGIGAYFYKIKINRSNLRDIGLVLLITTVIAVYILFNTTVTQRALGFLEGIVLLCLFGGYMGYRVLKHIGSPEKADGEISQHQALNAFLQFCVGISIVLVSSGFVVDSAVKLADMLGISKSFIGATVIAIGTSLPELSVSIHSIRKKQYGIALGNLTGANLVNLTLVLGVASLINPISVQIPVFVAALLFAVITNSVLFYVAVISKGVDKLGGILFLLTYVFYLVVISLLQTLRLAA